MSEVVASNVDHLLARTSLLRKDDCVEEISSDVPSCRAKAVDCSDLLSLSTHCIFRRCEVVFGGTHGVKFCRI